MRGALAFLALVFAASAASGQPTPVPTPAGAGAVAPSDQTAVQPALPDERANRNVDLGVAPAPAGPEEADTGVVVNFEEGRNVVLRRADGTQIVYPVAGTIAFPPELRLYEQATVYRVPLAGGGFRVTRLVVGPPGAGERTGRGPAEPPPSNVEEPGVSEPSTGPAPASAGSVHRRNGVAGRAVSVAKALPYTVVAFEPGRTLTLRRPEGTSVVLSLSRKAVVPKGLAPGQTVTIRTRTEHRKRVVTLVRLAGPTPVLTNVD